MAVRMTYTLRASLEAANPAGSISLLFGNPRDGVAWPYPRIFPGASAPYLWRPGGTSPSGFASARRRLSISTSARLPPPLRLPVRLSGPAATPRHASSALPVRAPLLRLRSASRRCRSASPSRR
ncbi:hypothetical protein PVAP13_5NG055508 [Panicum virgatum]|uniref:Uncharacterized protein n=1 Tax=Panicum virgatum TaxID=38727 RepID=A0A8T0RNG3_PANVG|nr:hypothetical protein PVAP13_5NG055508 [Panicum virgatum]KAG2586377.1 hypothetical protein PVAP13_5NG055508 [Panicum virgatum]KAG2586378.1 hypothetical protein PVAP13_5NG055508 [Panicum virgatum]KAG2586379.1 hypothetical protein PVAP13_5NG055508 [Panicum virgatum]